MKLTRVHDRELVECGTLARGNHFVLYGKLGVILEHSTDSREQVVISWDSEITDMKPGTRVLPINILEVLYE